MSEQHPMSSLLSQLQFHNSTHSSSDLLFQQLLIDISKHHQFVLNNSIRIIGNFASFVDFLTTHHPKWNAIVPEHELICYNNELAATIAVKVHGPRNENDVIAHIFKTDNDNNSDTVTSKSSLLTITVVSSDSVCKQIIADISKSFETAPSTIEWVYSDRGDSVTLPLNTDHMPVPEMYPFLPIPLYDFYEAYNNSSASILLLIGPPGTGKTTFIRGFLQYFRHNTIATYDPTILRKDHIFAEFIESANNVMVMEDADVFLESRENGNNTMMHKFLAVGDGLISSKNKKLIFSTNLPSITDIDTALLRKGRCFSVVHFRALNNEESGVLANMYNIDASTFTKSDNTLAEILNLDNMENNSPLKRKVGFV